MIKGRSLLGGGFSYLQFSLSVLLFANSTTKEKETLNFLQAEEYYYVCQAHKRLGYMRYKDERLPQYEKAVSEYKKIFRLWNLCGENSFFQCFPEEYRKYLKQYYRRTFNINAVLASLQKIYQLMGEKKKSEKCTELFLRKTEELAVLPLDDL